MGGENHQLDLASPHLGPPKCFFDPEVKVLQQRLMHTKHLKVLWNSHGGPVGRKSRSLWMELYITPCKWLKIDWVSLGWNNPTDRGYNSIYNWLGPTLWVFSWGCYIFELVLYIATCWMFTWQKSMSKDLYDFFFPFNPRIHQSIMIIMRKRTCKRTYEFKQISAVVSHILYVHPYLGKWSNLTNVL